MATVRQAKHDLLKTKWQEIIAAQRQTVDNQSETGVRKTKSQPLLFSTGIK